MTCLENLQMFPFAAASRLSPSRPLSSSSVLDLRGVAPLATATPCTCTDALRKKLAFSTTNPNTQIPMRLQKSNKKAMHASASSEFAMVDRGSEFQIARYPSCLKYGKCVGVQSREGCKDPCRGCVGRRNMCSRGTLMRAIAARIPRSDWPP